MAIDLSSPDPAPATPAGFGNTSCLDGLAPLASRYDAFILDMWGVIHDGVAVYPGVTDCLARLRRLGKTVVVLSNAPRRNTDVATRAEALGLPRHLYDDVTSSGEEAWQHLAARRGPAADPWYAALDGACYHLGPDRDADMRHGLDEHFTDDITAAGFVLLTGAIGHEDGIEDYQARLETMLARHLPMICANPDLVVMRGDKMEICAGLIADRYADMGGDVRYHGKPHGSVYQTCFRQLGEPPRARILAVGDSLRTDVTGARAAGIDIAFLPGGIHTADTGLAHGMLPEATHLAATFERYGMAPSYAMAALRW